MHAEKDAHIWKSPEIDRAEQEEIKKYTTKDHKVNMGLIICSYELLNTLSIRVKQPSISNFFETSQPLRKIKQLTSFWVKK